MKVTVLNQKEKKDYSIIYSIILLVLGIFLTFNSEGLLNVIFSIIGGIVILFGVFHFYRYYQLKNQLKVDDANSLIKAIISISVGLLVIFLSSFLTNTIQIVTGIWLFFMGLSKISRAFMWKAVNQNSFITQIISASILMLLGIYTIFASNVVFIFIGIVLIVYSIFDIVQYFVQFNKKH